MISIKQLFFKSSFKQTPNIQVIFLEFLSFLDVWSLFESISSNLEFVHVGHGLPEDFFVYSCYRFCYRCVTVLEPQRFTHFGGLTDSNTYYNIFKRMIHMGAVDLSA